MSTLQDYLNETRRLLHDANDRLWSYTDKVAYINEARRRVNVDCALLRTLQTVYLSAGQELFGRGMVSGVTVTAAGSGYTSAPSATFSAPPAGGTTAVGTAVVTSGVVTDVKITNPGSGYTSAPSVTFSGGGGGSGAAVTATILNPKTVRTLGVTYIDASFRRTLSYMPFQKLQVQTRAWQNYQTMPVFFSQFGQTQWYISPVPSITYASEWNTVISPPDLASLIDVCPLADEARSAVAYYAARKAKIQEQMYTEAKEFQQMYMGEAAHVAYTLAGAFPTSPYSG